MRLLSSIETDWGEFPLRGSTSSRSVSPSTSPKNGTAWQVAGALLQLLYLFILFFVKLILVFSSLLLCLLLAYSFLQLNSQEDDLVIVDTWASRHETFSLLSIGLWVPLEGTHWIVGISYVMGSKIAPYSSVRISLCQIYTVMILSIQRSTAS